MSKSKDVVIAGTVLSIHIHDERFADNEYLVTSLLRAIASNAQYSMVSGQRYIDSLDEQVDRNVNGVVDPETGEMVKGPNIDPDTGEVRAMTEKQEQFYDNLEVTQELCVSILADMSKEFNARNDNPNNKLLYKSNAEVRKGIEDREAGKLEETAGKSREAVEAEAKMRADRKAEREAKLAEAGVA